MSTQLVRPLQPQRFEIRCNVADAIVANLAVHIVFFFQRQLDVRALSGAFAQALTNLPIFAGRIAMSRGRMRIRCEGQGVPFTTVSSDCTLRQAIRSASDDAGGWLVDPVNGPTARWGRGPLCKVRVTQLANDATAIGFSWHHAIGDMQTAMHFLNAWVAAAAGRPVTEPLIVEDRAAYLDEHLPADGAREPGVRCLGFAELARSALYLAKDARTQRILNLYFSDDEIARLRDAYGSRVRLSANDVVCAHVSESLMNADPAVDHRSLAIAVNTRKRCGLDPMLVGNILTTLNLELHRGQVAASIAERIRYSVDHFADDHCDMRINQQFLDAAGAWRAARCVSTAFNPNRWNPVVTNWSGFGVYRVRFEDTVPCYVTPLMKLPVAGIGTLMEGADGLGLAFQMSLPPMEFAAISNPGVREHLHRFRGAEDELPHLN
ncbi:acyltransferase [[Mycobacterium] crassicus]|uniref:Acyltransferase n=1 Tax=[Mycobacterium] crassicus TaxID=2872309 RepID=A0ABU5XFY6_9MYCO|nr:acyltransferase [Mycolicibacter sp. MYC098]MEB3021195.1 acyltransferase [Mycolicibacter sp. MYC098]